MQQEAIIFSKPQYSKLKNQAGTLEPCYTFSIKIPNSSLSGTVDRSEFPSDDAHLLSLIKASPQYISELISQFITFSAQYFTRSYTVQTILQYLNHKLNSPIGPTADELKEAVFTPVEIVIFQGRFTLVWNATFKNIVIDIPDLGKTTADESSTDLIPVDDIEADLSQAAESIQLDDSSRHYQKQRVKEAQLRARLAQYKAERAVTRYLNKYGADTSDSDWSSDESDSD